MKIAVDFDSTLCERYSIPTKDTFKDIMMYPPTADAPEAIKWLKKCGHDIYVFTANEPSTWPKIKAWLKENGFPPLRVTNIKELGTKAYVDDRAIRFTNWQDIRKLLE